MKNRLESQPINSPLKMPILTHTRWNEGKVVRAARMRFADGGGRNEPRASCIPPQWGGGELHLYIMHTRQQKTAAETFSD